ncbi:hypothetical protein BDV96DRAFT_599473 [Lophiotrema nucula]|uniref:Uncharacterized protein n=1 Tax=Lophiotrema nucula TaxID=690887 RepID=A0A6A5ZBX8_9PLEO|nr:hypothetical protein BDV96DRAFT_599473 [Lophiotrema nucula]
MPRKEKKPRPEIRVMKTSRNPDYNLYPSSYIPTFARDGSGQRVMPLAQLNTFTGRFLAEEQSLKGPSYTEGVSRSVDVQNIRERMNGLALNPVSPAKDEKECAPAAADKHDCKDRGHLPAQLPQHKVSHMTRKPRCTAQNLTTDAKKTLNRSGSYEKLQRKDSCWSQGSDSGAQRLHRTPSVASIAASLPAPLCKPCISIPGYLLDEYLQFFPGCTACGYMTAEVLDHLVAEEGEVGVLIDDDGKPIFGPSKELQDWCLYVATGIQKISRKDSNASLADTLSLRSSSSTLKRSGAVRRSPTNSTTSSKETEKGEDPMPVMETSEQDKTDTKRFSFDPVPVPTAAPPIYLLPTEAISSGSSLGDPFFLEAALDLPARQPGHRRLEITPLSSQSAERPNGLKRTFSQVLGRSSRPTALRRSPGIHPLVPHPRASELSPSLESDGEIHGLEVGNIAEM